MFDSLLCFCIFLSFVILRQFLFWLKLFGYLLLCFPGPSETVRGSNFYDSCPFVTKMGSNFYFWTGNVFPNRSSDFCPRMAKGGVC
jgi:hypothetical protein